MPGKNCLRVNHEGSFMSRTCIFVDGGYFQKVLEKDFNKAAIDFSRLGPALSEGFEPFLRAYYYNCLPYQSSPPTPDERDMFAKAERFYYSLRKIPNLEIRLGRLEFRGVSRETGRPIFEQKRVDVQLAVDLLTLSFSGQIATAVVVAGDSDFIPAFKAAKDRGVRIVVVHGVKNPPHRDLLSAADQRIRFDDRFISSVRRV